MSMPAYIGHNNPPGAISMGHEAGQVLSDWMKEHPVIANDVDARAAKLLLDRAVANAADIETERDNKVRPLNEQVADINADYKAIHNIDKKKPGTLDRIVNELKSRLATFITAETARREAEAEAKRIALAEAERIAREAEDRERDALDSAKAGELGVDVVSATSEADSRFAEFKRANREAARADKDSHVKIGGGFRNAVSLRTVETLHLDSYSKAIRAIGPNDKIREAVLSAARDYRKLNGTLPEGVTSTTERTL